MSVKVKKRRGGIWNVKSVLKKNSEIPAFFDENSPNFFWQKISQHAAQLNGVPSINEKKKVSFPSLL